ncbi:MAG: hypothetical protein MHPDNHAH_01530 [Anaerolineales bacterium]|nr:hypothetical protein [Anaerolineales bacterium]
MISEYVSSGYGNKYNVSEFILFASLILSLAHRGVPNKLCLIFLKVVDIGFIMLSPKVDKIQRQGSLYEFSA